MRFFRIFLIMILSYFLSIVFHFQSSDWIKDVIIPSLGILVGVIVGAVGVFLGGLGNVLNSIYDYENSTDFNGYLINLDSTVKELKDNIVLCLGIIIFCIFVYFVFNTDIPYVDWPWNGYFSCKSVVCSAAIIAGFVLCFWAIVDSVEAMFGIHKQYTLIISNIKGNK
ncbi:hypothetical protein [Solidesulfovibrio sp. C21]|uniref:hypothetical protein n=1 Tax=Solidesulfovibrio sp. C21 TaxID=3398613 RepID=UPI0039FC447B